MGIPTPAVAPPPRWMRACAAVCFLTLVATAGGDLFYPPARGVEVWLGFEVTGPLALVTAPIHWTIFAVATWAFWTGRSWIVPFAAGYLFYVAVSHFVWSEASPHGRGWRAGLLEAAGFSVAALLLLQRRGRPIPR